MDLDLIVKNLKVLFMCFDNVDDDLSVSFVYFGFCGFSIKGFIINK